MKIYAIKDELDEQNKNLAYLFYYEKEEKFYIEMPDNIDSTELPIILSVYYDAGLRTVSSYWSKRWVMDRIIPSDRQNIGEILKNAGLQYYDEYQLLVKSKGRCSQDTCYIEEIKESELPDFFQVRNGHKVVDVVPLEQFKLLVFFRDGTVRKIETKEIVNNKKEFYRVLKEKDIFERVNVETAGQGIEWSQDSAIGCEELYKSGVEIPLSLSDMKQFVQKRVIDTQEVGGILECSKQNVEDLVRRGRLTPLKQRDKYKLFLKSEVVERIWK